MDTRLLNLDTQRVHILVPRVDGRNVPLKTNPYPYPYTSTYSPAHREMEREGVSMGILSEVTLDQSPRMTLYTTRCGKEGWLATTINQCNLTFQASIFLCTLYQPSDPSIQQTQSLPCK